MTSTGGVRAGGGQVGRLAGAQQGLHAAGLRAHLFENDMSQAFERFELCLGGGDANMAQDLLPDLVAGAHGFHDRDLDASGGHCFATNEHGEENRTGSAFFNSCFYEDTTRPL